MQSQAVMNLQDAVGYLTQLGVTGLLAAWLWLERSERIRLQEEYKKYREGCEVFSRELQERTLKSLNDTANAMSDVRDAINIIQGILHGMRDLLISSKGDR